MLSQYTLIDPNAQLINVSDENERDIWASKLGVSIERLKTAVRATRSLDVKDLKMYLQGKQDKRTYN